MVAGNIEEDMMDQAEDSWVLIQEEASVLVVPLVVRIHLVVLPY